MTATSDLDDGDLELTARITTASNATFIGQIGDVSVVYKPVVGERPLWDFPDGSLAAREVAAYLISESLGWKVVPETFLREGPFGAGMVQLWKEPDPDQEAVTLVAAEDLPVEGWCHVFDGVDAENRAVSLIHEDSSALRKMAVFDIIVNNADRKGSHVLEMPDGHRHGIDHGVTFHVEHKLRTVLWGWLGEQLGVHELEGIERVRAAMNGELRDKLTALLSEPEKVAVTERCETLLREAKFPAPHGTMPTIPWPPL